MNVAPTLSAPGWSHQAEGTLPVHRTLPEEVPVAVVFNGTTLAVMMATPDDIADFAHGFALSEGVIASPGEVEEFEIVEQPRGIEARFWLRADRAQALADRRRSLAGPVGCGLCALRDAGRSGGAADPPDQTGLKRPVTLNRPPVPTPRCG